MGFQEWLRDASLVQIMAVSAVVGFFGLAGLTVWTVAAGQGEPVAIEEEVAPAEPSPSPEPEPESESVERAQPPEPAGPDVLSEAACEHFRNVVGDVADGVLTVEEIRQKMIEVRADGRFSEEPAIVDASTALVRAVTQDDGEAFLQAVGEMSDACEAVGL